jgi:hypothetical protein
VSDASGRRPLRGPPLFAVLEDERLGGRPEARLDSGEKLLPKKVCPLAISNLRRRESIFSPCSPEAICCSRIRALHSGGGRINVPDSTRPDFVQ